MPFTCSASKKKSKSFLSHLVVTILKWTAYTMFEIRMYATARISAMESGKTKIQTRKTVNKLSKNK